MLRFFKSFFGKKNEPTDQPSHEVETPVVIDTYQPVEVAPQPVKCGCGRSASGYCVGLHKLTPDEWAVHADNPKKVVAPAKAKKPAAKKAPAATKPAAITAAPKKPRAKKEAK